MAKIDQVHNNVTHTLMERSILSPVFTGMTLMLLSYQRRLVSSAFWDLTERHWMLDKNIRA